MATERGQWPRKTEEKNGVLLSAIKKAWEAGFTKGFTGDFGDDVEFGSAFLEEVMSAVDFWEFDERAESSPEKKGTRAPKTSSPKKPTGDPEELSKRKYDESLCRARKHNKGWPLQCWKAPAEGEDICLACMGRRDDDSMDFWGYYDEPLEDCCLNKNGKPHSWRPLAAARAEKKDSDRAEKKAEKLREKKKKEEEKERKKAEKEKEKADKKAHSEKKKRLKKLKEKKDEEVKEAEVKEVEEVQHEAGSPKEDAPENPVESEQEEELEEDTQSLGDPEPETVFEEYIHDGYTMKWNKVTNQLLDPDDDEVLGMMTFDEDGNPKPEINADDSEDDSDEE